jgi:zinc protease
MKYKNLILLCFFTFVGFVYPQSQDTLQTDPVNITPKAVLNRYIYSIGGMDKFKSVMDRTTVMSGTAMSQPINIMIMQKYPDKLFQELQAGEVKQLLYYNSGKGMMIIGDEKINIEGKELERLSMDANMQLLLDPESYGVKMELLLNEVVDSVECFKIKFTLPSGIRWFQYYANDSGLKVKEVKEIQTKQGLFEQETYFSDYREVNGLKYPFTLKQYFGAQEIDLTVKSIEINTGLEDKVFEVPE